MREVFQIIYILLITFPIFISLLLWLLSKKIASVVVKDLGGHTGDIRASSEQIREVAFSVVGLTLLVYTFSKLFFWIHWYASFNPDKHQEPDLVGLGIVVVVNLILGIWLLLGSKGIANFISKIRYAGIEK